MLRCALPAIGLALAFCGAVAWADNAALKETLAIQEAMQSAIQEAEPSIACILISRSEDYVKLGETPQPDGSGKLGRFLLKRAQESVDSPDLNEREQLKKLDMEHAGYVPEVFGSGVVIDESGLVLTAEHVVRDATKIFVRLPGHKGCYADIHAADPRSDLAVLRLIEPPPKLKAIKLGDGGKVKKGQFIISLANPFAAGFRDGSPSASWGIISNIRRRPAGPVVEQERVKPLYMHGVLLQTDARLNLGCSGGALLDLKGELVGLTTALAALTGGETAGGFALPIDAGIRRILEVLKKGEEVEYGFLGVQLGQLGAGGLPRGLQIQGVAPLSPAAARGLEARDVILSVNGVPINDSDDLFVAVGTQLAGSEAKLDILRGGVPRTITVTLAKFNVPGRFIASRRPAFVRGLRVDYLSIYLQNLHPTSYPRGVSHGVVIREVQPDSAGSAALLKANDIVTHVKGEPVNTPAEFYKKLQAATGTVDITLGGSHTVRLQ
ncbi:MAG: trypsin-like peptidase domain-containing protein [Planctomycetia bacterium]|nr:trypsin-like peptidase domain-containing protein [Planctomycetia bacterium]